MKGNAQRKRIIILGAGGPDFHNSNFVFRDDPSVCVVAQDFNNLAYGVSQARRGWLEPKNVINTYSLAELRSYLQRRHDLAA